MSRQARQYSEYLHLIVRGIGKQILFEDDRDRQKYLELLLRYRAEIGVSILAYCLMENHVHLLVHDAEGHVPVFMKKLGVSYAQYYNRKYKRSGHLFQDRYKSEIIGDDAYLATVYRYILNNPQKAGLCAAKDYRWSSYMEHGRHGGITDTTMLCAIIGAGDNFTQFMLQSDSDMCMEADNCAKDDAWALSVLKKMLAITSGTELQQYDRKERDNALALLKENGISIRQIERLTGINRGVIQKAKKGNKSCQ